MSNEQNVNGLGMQSFNLPIESPQHPEHYNYIRRQEREAVLERFRELAFDYFYVGNEEAARDIVNVCKEFDR